MKVSTRIASLVLAFFVFISIGAPAANAAGGQIKLGIAFVDAYIADSFFWKHYIKLNQAKQAVADSSPMNVVIDTIKHGLSITEEPLGEPDIAHYDSLSEIKLGHLFAEQCIPFFDPFGHRR